MTEKRLERRACIRFEVPGATTSYRKEGFFRSKTEFYEEFCPILDLSRGGVRFLSQKKLNIGTKISLMMSFPGEQIPANFKGEVRWSVYNPGRSYRYQVGVQFNPYGMNKNQNYPGNLTKIIALEQKFQKEVKVTNDDSENPGI